MGNMVAKLVIFSILLNLAAGVMMTAVVDSDGNKIFDRTSTGGAGFDDQEEYGDHFQNELEESIKPAGSLDDKGDQIYRVLDMMSLGFIYKFINIVDEYMFGFVNMLDNIMGPHMEDDLRITLFGSAEGDSGDTDVNFGALKIIITISYILMGISLFTGKDVVEG